MSRPATFNDLMGYRVAKASGSAHLSDMDVDRVSLVDKGANGRVFAILKRAGDAAGRVRKSEPATFAELLAAGGVSEYFAKGMGALAEIVSAALDPGSEPPSLTPEQRIAAVSDSVDEFRQGLVDQMTAAMADTAAPVAKSVWRGVL